MAASSRRARPHLGRATPVQRRTASRAKTSRIFVSSPAVSYFALTLANSGNQLLQVLADEKFQFGALQVLAGALFVTQFALYFTVDNQASNRVFWVKITESRNTESRKRREYVHYWRWCWFRGLVSGSLPYRRFVTRLTRTSARSKPFSGAPSALKVRRLWTIR